MGAQESKYSFMVDYTKDKVVLDVGCGYGRETSYLKDKGASDVIGGDTSLEEIEWAVEHFHQPGLYFLLFDAQQLPFQNDSFDVVISYRMIEHLPRYRDFLAECVRVLKDGGRFICASTSKEFISPYSGKIVRFSTEYPIEKDINLNLKPLC
jgi:ubiquinone/menaquinone biosynthesis C-methylase UbiE